MFRVETIQRHYSEAGHGKGAPDGIGGCLKRTADGLVAQGTEILTFESFVVELKKSCRGTEVIAID